MARKTFRLMWLMSWMLVLSRFSPTQAGTMRHDTERDAYEQFATSDPAFASVGGFVWRQAGSSFTGSGVLISDEWVLTAAHVVAGTDLSGGGIRGLSFKIGGANYLADEWIPHPEWAAESGELNAGVDIGLVRLGRPVRNVEPASLYMGTAELGETAAITGFGNQGTGTTGYAANSGGSLLAGQNVVDRVSRFFRGQEPILLVDFDNPQSGRDSSMGSRVPLTLEYLAAPGDSGGGLFIDNNGVQQVAGIVSYVSSVDSEIDSDYGDQAGFTRVSAYGDWIEQITGRLAATSLLGDFDRNGLLTSADIDFLVEQVRQHVSERALDLNDDNFLDIDDSVFWIEELFGSVVGDVNLDSQFDSTDFVLLFQSGEYEDATEHNSTWSSGDWNGDGEFDSTDLVFALQQSEFEANLDVIPAVSALSTSAVPEPSSLPMLISGWTLLSLASRRCRQLGAAKRMHG